MADKHKSMIRLDYASLGGAGTPDAEIDRDLVKKAKGMFGRQAREEILKLVDPNLRLAAAEVANREMNPELLYRVGQEAVGDAIKAYKIDQEEGFREFVVALTRQYMFLAKNKKSKEPSSPSKPPLGKDQLGSK